MTITVVAWSGCSGFNVVKRLSEILLGGECREPPNGIVAVGFKSETPFNGSKSQNGVFNLQLCKFANLQI